MAAHAGENDDCVLCFSIFCEKTTCLVQNRIIRAKMIDINTKILKKLLPQYRLEFLGQVLFYLLHGIFDSLKENFFRPTA